MPPFWNAAFLIILSILPKEMAAHKYSGGRIESGRGANTLKDGFLFGF